MTRPETEPVFKVVAKKQLTGQRLDSTGLYYYNARYYDPLMGRLISADTMVPDPINPQNFNRYSYCLNNPVLRQSGFQIAIS